MRDWLNAILTFIGTTSLTDVEYSSIDQTGMVSMTYNQEAYDQLSAILVSRENVSTMQDRLIGFFKAKGFDVAAANTASSEIYFGDVL